MKFLDGVKAGFGVTIGSIAGLFVIGVISKVTVKAIEESEKSDDTTETGEA